MIKDFQTYINEGLFDRNQSEFAVRKTDKGIEQVYIPKTKEALCKYIDIDIENAKKDGTYPNVNLNNINVSELGNIDELKGLFGDVYKQINPDISNWDIKYIPSYFFYGNEQIKEFTIPNSVTSIGDDAFSWCPNLTSVTIGNRVKRIRKHAFYNCSSLTSVEIPDSVTSIGYDSFAGCRSLTSVTIGNGVTSIGEGAFEGCNSLTSVIIPNNITSIVMDVFYGCSSLTSVTIGNSVANIGNYAFLGCSSLSSVEIPNSVTYIGGSAFKGCSSLTSVIISKNCRIEYSIKSNYFPENCKIIRK